MYSFQTYDTNGNDMILIAEKSYQGLTLQQAIIAAEGINRKLSEFYNSSRLHTVIVCP